MTTKTPLSKLLASATWLEAGTTAVASQVEIPDDWMQGRSVFGGLQVAVVLQAMRRLVPTVPLRTLQTTFFAPIAGLLRAEARIVRTGKSTIHVEGKLLDGQSTAALVIAVFGAGRPSVVEVVPPIPAFDERADAPRLPFVPGVSPSFTRHFEARWRQGGFPFTSDTSRVNVLDVSILDDGDATEEHLVAIADFIPPIALSHLSSPAPGSTLTWLLELFGPVRGLSLRHYRVDATLDSARDGYTSQSSTIWSPHGELLATSRQSMLVFG